MSAFRTFRTVFSLLSVLVVCELAAAQSGTRRSSPAKLTDPRPLSNTSGYAGQEMQRLNNRDSGRGYTSESLNQLALQNVQASIPRVGQQSVSAGRPSLGLNIGGPAFGKPFAGFSSAPTVSPYMNLFREDLGGNSDLNYSTLVRPQLQQQQINSAVQRQGMELSRRVQAIAAQPDFNPQGSEQQLPTGHTTVFMNHGRYYPAINSQRPKR
ncbi:MAG: hypothetical protein L0Z07_01440 [Planctomycetes bacterium]|nr:hypothetical protein [Planctomycetota bacterium]